MTNQIVTEIVEFKVLEGIEEEVFLKTVDSLEKEFHSKAKGFIDTEITKVRESKQFIMIQHWETIEDCKNVIKRMMEEEISEDFRNSIDPKTVKMNILEQIQKWK